MISSKHQLLNGQVYVMTTKTHTLRRELVPGVVFDNYTCSLYGDSTCSACDGYARCLGVGAGDGHVYCVGCLANVANTIDAECGVAHVDDTAIKYLSVIRIRDFIQRVYVDTAPTRFCRCCKVVSANGCCDSCTNYIRGLIELYLNIERVCACMNMPSDVTTIIRVLAIVDA